MSHTDKRVLWHQTIDELYATLEGEGDPIVRMPSICAVLKFRIPWVSWVGFYRVIGDSMLAVGPYQGMPGCLRIPFDRGVCGMAARTNSTQVVPDVHAFAGHIACDGQARSEIVVPVRDRTDRLAAVLDLDSHLSAAFDGIDRENLEIIASEIVFPPRN